MRPSESGGVILETGVERGYVQVGATRLRDTGLVDALQVAEKLLVATVVAEITESQDRIPESLHLLVHPHDIYYSAQKLAHLRPLELEPVYSPGIVDSLALIIRWWPATAQRAGVDQRRARFWYRQLTEDLQES